MSELTPRVERRVRARDLDELDRAFELAEMDWRDLLMAAGLADADWPRRLEELLP